MGPLVSQVHLDKVRSYITIAQKDGARIHCGHSVDDLSLAAPYQKVLEDIEYHQQSFCVY